MNTGERLIGFLLKDGQAMKMLLGKDLSSEGVLLKREKHVSYLANDSIKNIRLALPNEKEINFQ